MSDHFNARATIYLAGPINGRTDAECNDWRELVRSLCPSGWSFLDPMRRDFRGREEGSVSAIVVGDKADIDASDIVIANARTPSAGTSMEILYAWNRDTPVISISAGVVSPWVRYHSWRVVETEALAVAAAIEWMEHAA